MKKYPMLIVAATAVVAGAVVLNSALAQQGKTPASAKVAVCDMLAVFKDYQRAKDLGILDRLEAFVPPHDWSTGLAGGPRKVVREDQCIAGMGPKA